MTYLECRTLVKGEAVLAITMLTSPDAYEDEVDLTRDVIATIELADD